MTTNDWNIIRQDLEGGDLVMDIRIHNTTLNDWKFILSFIQKNWKGEILNQRHTKSLFETLSIDNFSKSEEDILQTIVLEYQEIKLMLPLFEVEEIEFFTNDVYDVNFESIEVIFNFFKQLSIGLEKEIKIYVENSTTALYVF